MRLGLGAQVGEIDVALIVAGDDDDPHAGHLRGRRIGPVRRRRNQADVAMCFAAACVVRADDEQARVLALRPCIGLQRDRRVAGRRAEHALQPGDHLAIAFGLIGGSERVHVRELAPGDRNHLGDRVQLHRARAQGDHRAIERDVPVGESTQIAQHLRFGVVAIERRVREERRSAMQSDGVCIVNRRLERIEIRQRGRLGRKDLPEQLDILAGGRLVERDADVCRVDVTQIGAAAHGSGVQIEAALPGRDGQRVEKRVVDYGDAQPLQTGREDAGQAMDPRRDRRQPERPVIDRVHRRDHGEQHLRGADVRCRLLPPDVLLARLQCQPIRGLSIGVDGHADQPPGKAALELVARRKKCRVRPPESHRHAEALA